MSDTQTERKTYAQLRDECKTRGLKIPARAKFADLEALLRDAEPEPAAQTVVRDDTDEAVGTVPGGYEAEQDAEPEPERNPEDVDLATGQPVTEVCGSCHKLRTECGGHEITDEMVAKADAEAQERIQQFGMKRDVTAQAEAMPVQVPAFRGRIRVVVPQADASDAVEYVECEHVRWGHESETAALKCARKLAASRGLTVR